MSVVAAEARSSLTFVLWALRLVGGVGLAAAVRTARWEGPRSPGAPASELFVFLVGGVVLGLIVAASYRLRRNQQSRGPDAVSRGAKASLDGAIALLVASVAGAVWLIATLDISVD